jgi:hypothetical protein
VVSEEPFAESCWECRARILGTPGGRWEVDIGMETQETVWGCVYSHEPGTNGFWNVKTEISVVASGSRASRVACGDSGPAVGGTLRTDSRSSS